MAFTITLYNQTSDRNVITKTIGTAVLTAADCVARDGFSVRSGAITLQTSTDISKCNYAYISELGRYYYIDDITIQRAGVYVLDLSVDVLMTFGSSIRALSGTIDRQENVNNGYIADYGYKALNYSAIVAKEFPNGMTSDQLILMTVG